MINKLPRWVWAGGAVLAFVAGMVNVVGLLGFERTPVSHLTATVSRIGISAAQADLKQLAFVLSIVGAFLGGAVISGALLRSATLQLGRRYSAALLLESGLLALAVLFLQRDMTFGIHLLCIACGLQNGMAATYSGAIVRTTHMTGIVTDLGVMIGQRLRGIAIDYRRIALFVAIISGFISGGVAAALIFPFWKYNTLLIPVAITTTASMSYAISQRRNLAPLSVPGERPGEGRGEIPMSTKIQIPFKSR